MKTAFPETPLVIQTKEAHLSAILHRAAGRRLVIICHGYTGTKNGHTRLFIQTARALQKAGLNVLRFDFMGSGDSSGEFNQMSPNTQIRDALAVLAWARRRYRKVAFLGLSFGGATAICASQQARIRPNALLTWSSVPDLKWWIGGFPPATKPNGDPLTVGRRFRIDLPQVDVPQAYVALDIPRCQIQGDKDNGEFLERFTAYCPKNDPLVKHLVVPGADHVFTTWEHRRRVILESVRWLKKQLV